jgi:PAS domain S-box-containing protein
MINFFDDNSICITGPELEKPGPVILYINNKFEELTGYKSEEVIGKTPRILQGEKTDRKTLDHLKDCCSRGEYFEGIAINYRKDGTPFHMVWNINPIKVGNQIVAFLSIQQQTDELSKTIVLLQRIRTKQEDIDKNVDCLFWQSLAQRKY